MNPVNHEQQLSAIIHQHFDEAEYRIEDFYDDFIGSTRAVLGRHWRHKKDIVHDLLVVPRSVYQLGRRALSRQSTRSMPTNRKQRELAHLIETQLLDLPSLQEKIQNYCTVYEHELQGVIQEVFSTLSTSEQQAFKALLSDHLTKLQLPSEGLRETIVFSVIGMAGKMTSQQVLFGSSIGAGQAIAYSVYVSQQGYWATLWFKFTGAPAWLSIAGGAGGVIAMLALVPVISPLTELVVNKVRGKKVLREVIAAARLQLTQNSVEDNKDIPSVVGQLAIYLQAIPDLSQFAKTAIGMIR